MYKITLKLCVSVFLFLTIFILNVSAKDIYIEDLSEEELQELISAIGQDPAADPDSVEEGTVSCFDYYHFNSIQTNLIPTVISTVPGTTMNFNGQIINSNNYPISNGVLYIKIFKLRESEEKNANGPFVVDQFVAVKNVYLKANESKEVSFEWKVPAWTEEGRYQAASFFVANEKYNLLGLSFTDDVVGNVAGFEIISEDNNLISLDKDSVKVMDRPYTFAAFPPRVSKTEDVTISTIVRNNTPDTQSIPVVLKLYSWDAMSLDNVVNQDLKTVKVPAWGSVPVSFVIDDKNHPVYLAEVSLKYKDTSSLLNIRFVREGFDRLRINFPAINKFPLQPGEEVEIFSCIHNVSDSSVPGKLILSLFDKSGKKLHSQEYVGNVNGSMKGIANKFIPKEFSENFYIRAELFQEDVLVDEDTVYYNCEDFNSCQIAKVGKDSLIMKFMYIIIPGGILLFVLLIAIIRKLFVRNKEF